jgi:hypothetical protein
MIRARVEQGYTTQVWTATRKSFLEGDYVDTPWPSLAPGDEIEVAAVDNWMYRGRVEAVVDADTIRLEVIDRQPAPLPEPAPGGKYKLPLIAENGWYIGALRMNQVFTAGDRRYRITTKPKVRGVWAEFLVAPASEEAFKKRPGVVKIEDYQDANPDSLRFYDYNLGRVLKVGDEWLYIEKITRTPYGSGDGTERFGLITRGHGHFVSDAQAKKLRTAWEAKDKVRAIEQRLKVAQQDIDYGGDPAAIGRLTAELNEARKAAGEKP